MTGPTECFLDDAGVACGVVVDCYVAGLIAGTVFSRFRQRRGVVLPGDGAWPVRSVCLLRRKIWRDSLWISVGLRSKSVLRVVSRLLELSSLLWRRDRSILRLLPIIHGLLLRCSEVPLLRRWICVLNGCALCELGWQCSCCVPPGGWRGALEHVRVVPHRRHRISYGWRW
jgi:hypothetical protein